MRCKHRFKKALLLAAFTLSAIGVARFCHHATKGFRLSKVQNNLMPDASASKTSVEQRELLTALANQKFHYFSRGLQSFVFLSEDGTTILKLFNNRYQSNISLYSVLSHLPLMGKWAAEKRDYFQTKLGKTFDSYEIAFNEMQDKTGLLYIHLAPTTDLPPQVTIIDPLGISHPVNLNETGFLIQKKADLVYPTLQSLIAAHKFEEAKEALSSLVSLFFWKWRHALSDNDPLIRTNYGYIDGKAIQIDVGPLSHGGAPLDQKQEIEKITASLKFWLTQNAPDLVPFLDQELHHQLSSAE